MAQLPPLTQLYNKIAENLSDDDLKKLRNLLVPEIFAAPRVKYATAREIFIMLQADNKIGHGNLGLLVQILHCLGKGRLAEEAEQLEQEQRTEGEAPVMSEAHRTLLLRNYPTLYQELDATRVLDYLHQGGVLTEGMRQEILAIPESHQRTRSLLDLILQMGDRAFAIFRTALGYAGYPHLMELLTVEQQQHMPLMPIALAIYPGFQLVDRTVCQFIFQEEGVILPSMSTSRERAGTGTSAVEKSFEKVIAKVSSRWDDLARELGFSQNQIKGLQMQEPDNDHRCREMLHRWRNREGREATLQVLKQALINIGERLTAESL